MDELLRAIAGIVGGFVLGHALATAGAAILNLPWVLAGAVLSAIAYWLEVPVRPVGTVSFAPVVLLSFSASLGPWSGLLLAFLGPLLAYALRPERELVSLLAKVGEATGTMAVALLAVQAFVPFLVVPSMGYLVSLAVVYFVLDFLSRIVRSVGQEGVRPGRALVPLLSSVVPHNAFFLLAAIGAYALQQLIGLVGLFVATVVFIEIYFPWRLLGEQSGLFTTSLRMIIEAIDLKDPYTSRHSQRVSEYAVRIARGMGLPESHVEQIRIAGLMHDVGKIGVRGSIIRKPARLSDEEMAIMRSHAEVGASIIADLGPLSVSDRIVRHHHEHYNGTGYPSGLTGESIPIGSRIILVADAFDSLVTDRPYRKGRSAEEAMEVLESNAGTQFDPRAVQVLKLILGFTS